MMHSKVRSKIGIASRLLAVAAVICGAAVPRSAAAAPYTFITPPFTAEVYAAHSGFTGGVAFAPDGDVWVNYCAFSGSNLDRFDAQTTTVVNTTTIHPSTGVVGSGAGCGMTNHPDGAIYTNTGAGVVRLDANTGAVLGGPFGPAGDALGIAPDPQTGNLVYVGNAGDIVYVDNALTTSGTFSSATNGRFIDGIYFDATGNYLFLSTRSPMFALTVMDRAGTIVQDVVIASEPDGIAFHATAPKFVATSNTDGTITRFDFPGDDFTLAPAVSTLASGGFRGDLSQVGADGCWFVTQDGTRYDDGTITSENSVVRICPGFQAPPGVATEACCTAPAALLAGPHTANAAIAGCVDATPENCVGQFNGTAQGPGTTCADPGICSVATTTTSTTLPITGACCQAGLCSVGTPGQCEVGTYQGDGTNCDAPGICAVCGNGSIESGEQCDDGNSADGDGCDAACAVEPCWVCEAAQAPTTTLAPALPGPSECTPDNGASCDDGDPCTVGDTCSAGDCAGNEVLIPAACRWVIVGDTNVQSRTRGETTVTGHVCGGRVRLGEFSSTNGDAVATLAADVGIQIGAHAAVTGDIVTGGSAVNGKPRLTLLPGLGTDVVAGGTTAVQSGDPTAIYDTLGTNSRVGDCADAQGDIAPGDTMLAGLPAGPDLGDEFIAAGTSLTLTATNPGGLNVFDFNTLISGTDGTLNLDGAGNAGSVFVLRVKRKLDVRLRSKIVLVNGTVPGNVILYSQAKCRFGLEVTGAGTVFCPSGKLILRERDQWQGALVGGRGRVELRDSGVLNHAPLQVGP